MNKEVETCNIAEDTVIAQRLVCDHVRVYGAVTKVPLTKEMLNYCATAHTRYRAYLDEEKSKRERDEQKLKRKNAEENLDELKIRRKSIQDVCESLQKDADNIAEQAENAAGTKMATLITKSNTLRKQAKEKREQLLVLNHERRLQSCDTCLERHGVHGQTWSNNCIDISCQKF